MRKNGQAEMFYITIARQELAFNDFRLNIIIVSRLIEDMVGTDEIIIYSRKQNKDCFYY